MQNASYIVQKFSENFSKITTVNQFTDLVKAQKFDLEIDLVHRIPSILTWYPAIDYFSGEYNLLVYPRITIDGKTFTPPKMVDVHVPSRMEDYEDVFFRALKQAISKTQQVWS